MQKVFRKKNFTREELLQKVRHYCRYQHRCHQEVREKLYSFAIKKEEVEELLSKLIEERSLNEEDFATAFARGKFRMKQWGKIKIRHELRLKKVSEYCIARALDAIEEHEYIATLEKLAGEKADSLSAEKNELVRKTKLRDYLLQKGFEPALINPVLSAA